MKVYPVGHGPRWGDSGAEVAVSLNGGVLVDEGLRGFACARYWVASEDAAMCDEAGYWDFRTAIMALETRFGGTNV